MAPTFDATSTAPQLVAALANEIRGKTILTTGVSPGGIGAAFVEAVAVAQPSTLILAGRNAAKVQATTDAITKANPGVKIRTLQLDLSSLDAVRAAAAEVSSWNDVPVIDVLVNNAGIMAVDFALTVDGFESQLASNHLGPFLFTNLIMDKISASKSPRIVNVSSDGHRLHPIRFADYNFDVSKSLESQIISPTGFSMANYIGQAAFKERSLVQQMVRVRAVKDSQYSDGTLACREARSQVQSPCVQPTSRCNRNEPR